MDVICLFSHSQVDSLGVIVEIVYIGQEQVEMRNLSQIIGWHESFVNNVSYSYSAGLVRDWISFFREGWATALCHDKFPELASGLRKALEGDKNLFGILDRVFEQAENSSDDQLVAGTRREIIGDRGELLPSSTKQYIETQTLEFLKKHRHMLSRFYIAAPAGAAAGAAMSPMASKVRSPKGEGGGGF